ncbi:hypothetical protein [Ensifer sp. B1-9]|uniref:hypothetical protein n=1 Tax=Ensifer sp. B1-9 TaxID=3141455 RepID=UPI003D2505D7
MTDPSDQPIHVLLLRLVLNLAFLVVPFVIPLYLPLPFAIAYWAGAMAAEWIEDRLFGKVDHTFVWMLGGCFGLSYAVAMLMSGTVASVLAGVACFLLLLWLQSLWEKRTDMRIERTPEPPIAAAESDARSDNSAWGSPVPVTPEGESLRVLACHEIAMGGPVICDYLLPDGSVILGAGSSTGFSADRQYFVSPSPSRGQWGLLIYDRRSHILYRCDDATAFWEIDLVTETTITGRHSPVTSNRTYSAQIAELIAGAEKEQMVTVVDLKIPAKDWADICDRDEASLPAGPAGVPDITSIPYLPDSLMALEAPLDPLYHPMAELVVDGVTSGLLISTRYPDVVWREDANAFACFANRKDHRDESGYWSWKTANGWREIAKGHDIGANRPYASRDGLAALDPDHLAVGWTLAQPELGYSRFGRLSSYAHAPLEIDGRTYPQPVVRQCLPLVEGGATESIESAPLNTGKRIRWHFLRRDTDLSCDVFTCTFGVQALEGEWLLDHRISATGDFIALVAYAASPEVPHRIAVLDGETGMLAWIEESLCDPQLQGFAEDTLHFVHLVGRIDDGPTGPAYLSADEAPQNFDEAVPPPAKARAFMEHRDGSALHYRQSAATLRNGAWRLRSDKP